MLRCIVWRVAMGLLSLPFAASLASARFFDPAEFQKDRNSQVKLLFQGSYEEQLQAKNTLRRLEALGAPPQAVQPDHAEDSSDLMAALRSFGLGEDYRGMVIQLPVANFAKGGTRLHRSDKRKLAKIASVLARFPEYYVLVEDRGGLSADEAENRYLSEIRAYNVQQALLDLRILSDRVRAIGYGSVLEAPAGSVPLVEIVLLPPPRRFKLPQWVNIQAYLKNEAAVRQLRPQNLTKERASFFGEGSGQFSQNVSYKISGRVSYDAVFALTHYYPDAVRRDEEWESQLRDTYLDISLKNFDMRLGNQQIVWGEAVGVFIADVVNGKDFREIILPSLDYIRTPSWAADIEWSKGPLHLEAVWLPVLETNNVGVPGSEFYVYPPSLPGLPSKVFDGVRPAKQLKNSEIGGRASLLVEGWDINAFYLYAWDRLHALRQEITPTGLVFYQDHRVRVPIAGGSFSKEIKDVVLKGETAYHHGQEFNVTDFSSPDGLIRKDWMVYLLGLDYTFAKKLETNLQWIQRFVFNYEDRLYHEDSMRNSVTVRLKTGFWDNKVEPEFFMLSNVRRKDMLIRPKLNFTLHKRCTAAVGLDFFDGRPDKLLGQFRGYDRFYGEVKFIF